MYDMGKCVIDEMKAQDKRTITADLLILSLEKSKAFSFLTGIGRS